MPVCYFTTVVKSQRNCQGEYSLQKQGERGTMLTTLKRFAREDDGMEMLEWAIVATVFAVVLVAGWSSLEAFLTGKLADIQTKF